LNKMLPTDLVPDAVSINRTVPHHYDLVIKLKTWTDAINYCRANFTDLAKILSDTDWLRFKKESARKGLVAPAWVGLYNDIDSWRWSLNNLPLKSFTYTNWCTGEPQNLYGIESCVAMGSDNRWYDVPCSQLRPFICYNGDGTARFVFISSLFVTWPEAQAYCRTYHTDLASSLSSSDNDIIMQVRNTVGDPWIGLYRDTWKWLDGTIASNLPWAPGRPDNYGGNYNCGVIYNRLYYDVPCSNQYYFLCDTIFPSRSQTVRLQVKSDGSVFDPAVQSSILEQIKQKLEKNGMLKNTTVTWKVQPDGNIFNKKKKDH
ncbi:secretory phospholipase A2 receptor-like isoform X1, partial [Silurus meridionalis]